MNLPLRDSQAGINCAFWITVYRPKEKTHNIALSKSRFTTMCLKHELMDIIKTLKTKFVNKLEWYFNWMIKTLLHTD